MTITDRSDDDDGVEEGPGERPLYVVCALIPVPATDLHLQEYGVLEVLQHVNSGGSPVRVVEQGHALGHGPDALGSVLPYL